MRGGNAINVLCHRDLFDSETKYIQGRRWTKNELPKLLEDEFFKLWYKRMWCWSFKSHSQSVCL